MEHFLDATLIDGTWQSSARAGTFCIVIERSLLIRLLDETYEFFCCDAKIAINIGNEDNSTSFKVHIVRASRFLCFTASACTDDGKYFVAKMDDVVKRSNTENNVDLYALMGLYGVTYDESLEKGTVTAKFKLDKATFSSK